MDTQRPQSVTVVCWIIIAFAAYGLVTAPINYMNPVYRAIMDAGLLSPLAMLLYSVVAHSVSIYAAAEMLKGRRRGRTIYLVAVAVGVAVGLMDIVFGKTLDSLERQLLTEGALALPGVPLAKILFWLSFALGYAFTAVLIAVLFSRKARHFFAAG